MDEYDAFGRKRDENSLGDLGWGATGEAPPPVEQPASPDVTTAPAPATPSADWTPAVLPSMSTTRRRGGGSWLRRFIALDLVLLVIGGSVYLVVSAADDAVDSVRDTIRTFPTVTTGAPPGGNDDGGRPPAQVQPRKLLTTGGFRDALRVMERETPGRISNLRLDAQRISYQVQRGTQYTIATLEAAGEVPSLSVTQERPPSTEGVPYGQVDATAPARITRAAGARLDKAPGQVDYLVLQDASGVRWIVYFKGGRYAIGDARGRITQVY